MASSPEEQINQQLAMAEWALTALRTGETAEDYLEIASRRMHLAVEIAKRARASLFNCRAKAKGKVAGI